MFTFNSKQFFKIFATITIIVLVFGYMSTSASNNDTQTETPAKEEKVKDTARVFNLPSGASVEVFESLNSHKKHYIAAIPVFKLLDNKNIAEVGYKDSDEASVSMRVELVTPEAREFIAAELSDLFKENISIGNVGNLPLTAIIIDVHNATLKKNYGIEEFILRSPAPAQVLDVDMKIKASLVDQFVKNINDGKITFTITYVFNNVSIDSREESLTASYIMNSDTIRNLEQQGKEVFSAVQIGDIAHNIHKELTSKVIYGFGKITSESLPIKALIEMFDISKKIEEEEKYRKETEQRLINQLDLKVDPQKFQPLSVQKKVKEILNSSSDIEQQKKNYLSEYQNNKDVFDVSSGFKLGPFSLGGDYEKELSNITNSKKLTDDKFKEILYKYHGIEYCTEEKLFRGVKLYDINMLKMLGSTTIRSITIKPTLTTSIRNLTARPNPKELTSLQAKLEKDFKQQELRLNKLEESPIVFTLPGTHADETNSWFDTGINANSYQTLGITCVGAICFNNRLPQPERYTVSPEGFTSNGNYLLVNNIKIGTLMGRFGNGRPFAIGSNKSIIPTKNDAGNLFLAVHDTFIEDNEGTFLVYVKKQ